MTSNHKKLILISDPHVWSTEKNAEMSNGGSRNLRGGKGARGTYQRKEELLYISSVIASIYSPQAHDVLIAGDIVEGAWSQGGLFIRQNTMEQEYKNAQEALKPLVNVGFDIHMVPGNHDYGPSGLRYTKQAHNRYLDLHREICGRKSNIVFSEKVFPYRVSYQAWQLLLLDSNVHNGHGVHFSQGRIGNRQLAWLEKMLESSNVPTVIALHHHPRPRNIADRALPIIDRKDFGNIIDSARNRGLKILICCGHKHVEDLGYIAAGKCTDNLRAIEVDPVNASTTGQGVTLRFDGQEVKIQDNKIRTLNRRQRSRRNIEFNNRRMTEGCIVEKVELERLDSRGRRIQGPASEVTMAPARIGGVFIVENAVGTNNLRVVVRAWNGSLTHDLRYRLIYTVRRNGNANCKL